jgi:hypothetical protein
MTSRSGVSPDSFRHIALEGSAQRSTRSRISEMIDAESSSDGPGAAMTTGRSRAHGEPESTRSNPRKLAMLLRIHSLPMAAVVTTLPFSSWTTWRTAALTCRETSGNSRAEGCHSTTRSPSTSRSPR